MEPGLSPLVVAALPNEAAATRRMGRVPVFVTGDGPILAHRLRVELERQKPSVVLAVGVAGGLDPALRAGQLLALDRVLDERGSAVALARPRGRHDSGVGISVRAIVPDPERKQALWARAGSPPGGVVDMETKIYADICEELGVPLMVFKVVSDGAEEAVPDAVLDAVGRDGSVSQLGVAWRAALRPWQIPNLARLGRRVAAASAQLAEAVDAELQA